MQMCVCFDSRRPRWGNNLQEEEKKKRATTSFQPFQCRAIISRCCPNHVCFVVA